MMTLTEYLGDDAIEQLAGIFSSAAGSPVRILTPGSEVSADPAAIEVKVLVSGEHVGTISLIGKADSAESARMVELMR
ncbi:MAG: hypothetical protein KAV00_09715, partial [Phycisphaerae bacterium]|nr:hypothetical protein [Phycisphaerae bacterium]